MSRADTHGADDDLVIPGFVRRDGGSQLADGEIACRICGTVIRKKRHAQRFCSVGCRVAALRLREHKKSRKNTPRRKRLYPPTEKRNKNTKKPFKNNGVFGGPKGSPRWSPGSIL